MSFTRVQEDFRCQHCGALVVGNGYTNHCPHCLWSRHVDREPGDRSEPCEGMMRPALLEGSSPHYRILHVCERCGLERVNNVSDNDSAEALVLLASSPHRPQGEMIDEKRGVGADPLATEQSFPEANQGDVESNIRLRKPKE